MMTECPYPKGKCRIKWISTEWLQDHLDDQKMMIVDVQPNIHDYIIEHIPGAVYLEEGCLRTFFKRRPGVWAPPEQIEAAFGRTGIKPELPLVVYTGEGQFKHWGDGLEQCMAAYSLVLSAIRKLNSLVPKTASGISSRISCTVNSLAKVLTVYFLASSW